MSECLTPAQKGRGLGRASHRHPLRAPPPPAETHDQTVEKRRGGLTGRSPRIRRTASRWWRPTRPWKCLRPPHQANGDTPFHACPTGPGSPPLEREACERGDDVNHEFRHGPAPTPRRTRADHLDQLGLGLRVAVAVIARTERAIGSASSRSVTVRVPGRTGRFTSTQPVPRPRSAPACSARECQWCGGGRAGPRTHPHASHDAAPSLTYWTPTNQTRH